MPEAKDKKDLVLRCREINEIAAEARALMNKDLEEVGKDAGIYTFKERIKPAGKILSKVLRKQKDEIETNQYITKNDAYSPDKLTDAWGCRYVTLYQNEIPNTVKILMKKIGILNNNELSKIRLVESVVYTNRPLNDPLSIANIVNDIIKNSGLKTPITQILEPENRKSAYSSVHFIFEVNVTIDQVGRGIITETAKFEVQIRDIFEEGWGEIQHDLLYSEKDGIDENADEFDDFRPLWVPHLNALKTFVDGCSQHASLIKESYNFVRNKYTPSIESVSTTDLNVDRESIISTIKENGINGDILSLIDKAYDLMMEGKKDSSEDSSKSFFETAAQKFYDALTSLGPKADNIFTKIADKPISFFLRTELANCWTLSKDESRLKDIVEIHESLIKKFPNDATAHARLAHAIVALELSVSESVSEPTLQRQLELREKALQLLKDDPLTGPKHWLGMGLAIGIGYTWWQLSNTESYKYDPNTHQNAIKEAVLQTKKYENIWNSIDPFQKRSETYASFAHKAISNILFYLAEIAEASNGTKDAEIVDAIQKYLKKLEELDVPLYKDIYKTRDNMMRALYVIGELEKAKRLAYENVKDIRSIAKKRVKSSILPLNIEPILKNSERQCYKAALRVIAAAGDEETKPHNVSDKPQ